MTRDSIRAVWVGRRPTCPYQSASRDLVGDVLCDRVVVVHDGIGAGRVLPLRLREMLSLLVDGFRQGVTGSTNLESAAWP